MRRPPLIILAGLLLAGCGGASAVPASHTQTQRSVSTTVPALSTTSPAVTTSTTTAPPRTRPIPAGATAARTAPATTSGTTVNSGGVASGAPNIGCPSGDTQSGLACLYHGGDPAGNPSGKVNPTRCPSGTSPEDGGCMPDPASQSSAAKTTTAP